MNINGVLAISIIFVVVLCVGNVAASDPPEFTSTPITEAYIGELYEYEVEQTDDDNLSLDISPYWILLIGNSVIGVPQENNSGIYAISLSLTRDSTVIYQNYTIAVNNTPPIVSLNFIMFFTAMILLVILNIIGILFSRVKILTLYCMFGIVILAVPTAIALREYGSIALILILINIVLPVSATANNLRD